MTIKNEYDKQQEQLSKALDALNNGMPYACDKETEELIEVARLVKRSGAADQASSKLMADTVDRLASELGARSRKRRKHWLFSSAAGAVAAVWMLISLNTGLLIPDEPNRMHAQNEGDLAKIVQIQQEETKPKTNQLPGPLASGQQPEAGVEKPSSRKAAPEVKPETMTAQILDPKTAPDTRAAASKQAEVSDKSADPQSEKVLALAGLTARAKTVDPSTGEIRQSYATEAGEVTLVQGSKSKPAGEAVTAAPKVTAMLRSAAVVDKDANKEAEKQPAGENATEKTAAKVNKVTVTVDGVEATLEGEQSEEELKKLAGTVVKQ